MEILVKRIYEKGQAKDGYRILVDRLWPRGVSKQRAAIDDWLKEVAPSPELRTWFNHKPARFAEFSQRYQLELEHNPAAQELLASLRQHKTISLLYAARDPKINHAMVLKDFLLSKV